MEKPKGLTRRQELVLKIMELENDIYGNPTMDNEWFEKQSKLNGLKQSLVAIRDREYNKGKRAEGVTPYRIDMNHLNN